MTTNNQTTTHKSETAIKTLTATCKALNANGRSVTLREHTRSMPNRLVRCKTTPYKETATRTGNTTMVGTNHRTRYFLHQKRGDEANFSLVRTHDKSQQLGPIIRHSALPENKGVSETHAFTPNNQAVGLRLPWIRFECKDLQGFSPKPYRIRNLRRLSPKPYQITSSRSCPFLLTTSLFNRGTIPPWTICGCGNHPMPPINAHWCTPIPLTIAKSDYRQNSATRGSRLSLTLCWLKAQRI